MKAPRPCPTLPPDRLALFFAFLDHLNGNLFLFADAATNTLWGWRVSVPGYCYALGEPMPFEAQGSLSHCVAAALRQYAALEREWWALPYPTNADWIEREANRMERRIRLDPDEEQADSIGGAL